MRLVPNGLSIPFDMITIKELCSLHWNDVTVDGDFKSVIIKSDPEGMN